MFLYYHLQNTFTNADRLLETADQLAQTGECNPDDIYQVAKALEQKVRNFVARLECRKSLLDMSVSFHTHAKEVSMIYTSGTGQPNEHYRPSNTMSDWFIS